MKTALPRRKSEFPLTVSRGSVAVKIYRIINRGRTLYTVAYRGPDRRRVRQNLASLGAAKAEAERIATAIANGETLTLNLSNADRGIYVRALELLRPHSRQLDVAVAEFVDAVETLRGTGSLLEAARFFARHHSVGAKDKALPEIFSEFLAAKKADGASVRYLQDCRARLARFVSKFSGNISDCTTTAMQEWLVRLEVSPRARNNMRTLIVTLFNFAKQRGYLPKERSTEADSLSKAKAVAGKPGILQPDELSLLLEKVDPSLQPYIAIGAFAGPRQAELMRLDWSEIKLDQGVIEITVANSKTAQRRLIPIQPNLANWLQPHLKAQGALYRGWRILGKVTSAAKHLGIRWPNNALRHSYASYRLASVKNAAEVALEMGNSPRMIFEHYRELVTPADAAKWWTISPPSKPPGRRQFRARSR